MKLEKQIEIEENINILKFFNNIKVPRKNLI